MYIEKVAEATDELRFALQRLIPLLGVHKAIPSDEELTMLIESEGSSLLIAREPDQQGEIVGMLSLTIYRVPTGVRSIVEDVVVEEAMRGRGIGNALVNRAIEIARDAGANGVSLTSNPQR